jgi:DNA-directed RNA polymerase subunit RPC12/RpoP
MIKKIKLKNDYIFHGDEKYIYNCSNCGTITESDLNKEGSCNICGEEVIITIKDKNNSEYDVKIKKAKDIIEGNIIFMSGHGGIFLNEVLKINNNENGSIYMALKEYGHIKNINPEALFYVK